MSQVRKLLNGAVLKAKEGTYNITLDGQNFSLTDEQLNQINNDIAALDPNLRRFLGGVGSSIKSGSFSGNRSENTISGEALSGLNDREMKSLKNKKSGFFESAFKSNTYWVKEAINEALNIISKRANTKPTDNRTKLGSDVVELDYNTNANGKRYLSPINYSAENRVNQILEHLKAGDASTYNPGDWDFSNIKSWINSQEGDDKYKAAADYFSNLWSKMRNPGFDEDANYNGQDVEDILAMFHIKPGSVSAAASTGDGKSSVQKQLEADFGENPGLYDVIGDSFEKGSDGRWRLKAGQTFNPGIQLANGQGIWFNDDFYNSAYADDPRLNALKNLTYYNGTLYKLNDSALADILNKENGYNSLMKSGNWSGADNIIMSRFTEGARNNPQFLNSDQYSTFLNPVGKGRLGYRDYTGMYQWLGGETNPTDQVIQYIDFNDPSSMVEGNPYRRYNWKWALLDQNGNFLQDLNDSDMQEISDGSVRENGLTTYKRISDRSNPTYNGRYYQDITDKDGNPTQFRFYMNPSNPNEDVILQMPQINARNSQGKNITLPKEIAKLLMDNKESWLDNVVGNAQAQSDFIEVMSHLTQGWNARTDQEGLFGALFKINDRAKLRRIFNNDEAKVNAFIDAMKNAIKGKSKKEREKMYYTSSPRLQKLGGILKNQNGGKAGGTNKSIGVTEHRINTEGKNFKNAAGIAEIGSDDWTQYDTMDLAALAGDLGSLAAAFVPGANIASAGIGAASSTARFAANKGRGTKGAGLNYGIDLAMDAATMLPLLGAGVKGTKVVKAVKNALPLIIKAASVYGLGAAVVNSATKIANGEKWTPRDLSMVANALTAGVGLARQGGFGKSTKKVSVNEPISLKSNNGATELKLNSNEMKSIDTPDKLFDALFKKAKVTNPELTKEAFADQYDVNSLLTVTKRWRPSWNPKKWFKKEEIKAFKPSIKKQSMSVESNGKSLHDWWYGVGNSRFNQIQYDRQLRGLKPKSKISGSKVQQEIVMPENNTSGLMELNVPAVVRQTNVPYTRYQNILNPRGIALPQWVNPFTRANYQGYQFEELPGMSYRPLYKKGGKVVKALYGNSGIMSIASSIADKVVPQLTKKKSNPPVGGFNLNMPDITKYLNPLASAMGYISTADAQKDYRDTDKQRIEASRYNVLANHYSTPDINNPAFARQQANINQQRASGSPGRFTNSNQINNEALWQQNNQRLDTLETDLLGRESEYLWNGKNAVREAQDMNFNADVAATNQNAQINALTNSALFNPELEYIQRRNASRDAARLEFQNNLMKDRETLLNYNRNEFLTKLNNKFDSDLRAQYGDDVSKYNALSYNDKAKYAGLEDYLSRTVTGAQDWIAERQKKDFASRLQFEKDNSLLTPFIGSLSGSTSTVGRNWWGKKGGRLAGKTRYTKEPDEQIWIDNNKAAHNAIAKLSDQTIKLILKTLK